VPQAVLEQHGRVDGGGQQRAGDRLGEVVELGELLRADLDIRSEDLGGIQKLRYYAGVFLGEGRDYNKFTDAGFMYVGRFDVLPLGLFDDYDASDLWRLQKLRVSFGVAFAYNDRAKKDRGVLGAAPADGGSTNYQNATTDLMIKYAGWSLEAGYLWRQGKRNPGSAVDEDGVPIAAVAARNGQGWLVQTALLIPRTRLEPALRYSGYRGIGVTSMPDRDEVGGGLNYYFFGHNLKLQVDYFRNFAPGLVREGGDLFRLQIQAALSLELNQMKRENRSNCALIRAVEMVMMPAGNRREGSKPLAARF